MENPFEALVKINDEINSVQETDLLFNRVMDIAMETLSAERGFLLLKTSGGKHNFEPVVARNIDKESILSIQELSSSVVNQVIQKGEPVLTVDAQTDQRFSGAESIMIQNIRSVVCTPLGRLGEIVGAIYMDSRAGSGRFDEDSLRFLSAFSKQAAVAIENSRFLERLRAENETLRQQVSLSGMFPGIIGKSQPMLRTYEMIKDVADASAAVLVEGESGTGKELVARALHFHSLRSEKPFIPIFCGSLSENLLESELFGHKKGAFTGALENKAGLFEEANGGTILLDEIGDIDLNIQTKLLRVLQEGEIKRVGDNQLRKVDVRVVSATNKDLWKEVDKGTFREDLYYRLNVINIKLPPLRERIDDIPLLADYFLKKYAERNKKNIKGFTKEALKTLQGYRWPGNVRELENAVERAVILSRDLWIGPSSLSLERPGQENLVGKSLKEIEKYAVIQTLELTKNNRSRAAEILGVSRRWLQYQLKEWGMTDGD